MFTNKKDFFSLTGIVFAAIAFYVCLNNLGILLQCAKQVFYWFQPVIAGLAIAFILNVFVQFIECRIFARVKNKKILRPFSIILTFVFIFLVFTVILKFIVPEIKNTLFSIIDSIPDYFNATIEMINKINLPIDLNIENYRVEDIVQTEHFSKLTSFLTNTSVSILGNAINITTSFAGTMFSVILSIVIAIYVLIHKEKITNLLIRTTYALFPHKVAREIRKVSILSYMTFRNFITGQLAEAIILGLLCFGGMTLFNFPYSTAIRMLVAVTALVPIVGAFVGTIVGAFLIVIVSPLKALFFVIYLLVLQQIEGNLIYPKVVGKSVGLPAILVISAVLVGGRIGGLMAVLLSVPVCSVFYSLFKSWLDRTEKKKIAKKKSL